jgi:hypothetical protein
MKTFTYLVFFLCLIALSNKGFAQKGKTKEKTGVTAKYDYAGPFYQGLARVKLNKKWGFIDTTGNVVVPLKYDEVENFSEGIARVRMSTKHGSRWGLVNSSGTEIRAPTFVAIYEFINGKALALLDDGQKYYINREGNRVD